MSTLTPRERQVCDTLKKNPDLTLRGLGNHLGISRHTVNIHLHKIYDKTGVNNKAALVASMYQSESRKI